MFSECLRHLNTRKAQGDTVGNVFYSYSSILQIKTLGTFSGDHKTGKHKKQQCPPQLEPIITHCSRTRSRNRTTSCSSLFTLFVVVPTSDIDIVVVLLTQPCSAVNCVKQVRSLVLQLG